MNLCDIKTFQSQKGLSFMPWHMKTRRTAFCIMFYKINNRRCDLLILLHLLLP